MDRSAATKAMEALAALGGEANAIDAPLVFEGGRMRIGPVPLGAAPRLAVPTPP